MQMRGVIGIFLVAFLVEANEKKPVGDEFWDAAKAIRAAEVVLQDAMQSPNQAGAKDAEFEVVDAATQLLKVTENVVKELRGAAAPAGSKKKKLALARQLNRMGRTLRFRRRQHHRHHLSALQDFNTALKSIRKAIAEVKIAAWDAERRGVDSAARAAAVVVADEARRLFHLTSNMAHEEHKAAAVHNNVAEVAAAVDANLTTWGKVGHKHCRHHKLDSVGNHYGSLVTAKKACEVRDNCVGIYQSGCSGFHFYLCAKDYPLEDSGSSCVYHKPSAEIPQQVPAEVPVEQAAPEVVAQKPPVQTLAAKAAAAQALATQAQKESDRLMDEAVAEVATAAQNAEQVANTVYGRANPSVSESVLEVEKASEGLKKAVLASRASHVYNKVQLNNVTVIEDVAQAAPTTTTSTTSTTRTTTTLEEMVAKVDEAFDKLEESFKPVPKLQSQEPTESEAEQDLERLVGSAKEAPMTRAFTIQQREDERQKEQAKEEQEEQKANEMPWLHDDSTETSVPSVPHHRFHNLSPADWKTFNAPDSSDSMDAELDAAFDPVSKESEPTAQEEHDRLQTVAAAVAKSAQDARREAEESRSEEIDVERPRRRFRSTTPEVEPIESQPVFQPEVEGAAGIEVPANQLAFEKAVGMTVEPGVTDEDQDEEAKHWRAVRKHHKRKHKKHHHSHR